MIPFTYSLIRAPDLFAIFSLSFLFLFLTDGGVISLELAQSHPEASRYLQPSFTPNHHDERVTTPQAALEAGLPTLHNGRRKCSYGAIANNNPPESQAPIARQLRSTGASESTKAARMGGRSFILCGILYIAHVHC